MKKTFKVVTIWPSRSWAVCNIKSGTAIAYFKARILAESFMRNLEQGIV